MHKPTLEIIMIIKMHSSKIKNERVICMNKSSLKKNTLNILLGTTISLGSIALLNKLVFIKATKQNLLYAEQKDYYRWRYGNVFYTVKGSGSPILLIHGIGIGSSSYNFKEISKELAKKHTVYEIDLLGFGRSDKPKITYTAYLYVQLISDFIKNIIKRPTDVIASSLSGAFVIMCCHQNEELFKNIMLVNPSSIQSLIKYPNRLSNLSRKLLEFPLIGTSIYNSMASKYSIRKFLQEKGFYKKEKVSTKMVKVFHESSHLGHVNNKYPSASFLTNYMNIDIRNAFADIDKSIYVVWSRDNQFSNEPVIQQYKELNPSIEYSTIDDSRLLPHMEKPQEFLNICDIFF